MGAKNPPQGWGKGPSVKGVGTPGPILIRGLNSRDILRGGHHREGGPLPLPPKRGVFIPSKKGGGFLYGGV